MSLNGRLARLEKQIISAAVNVSDLSRQASRVLRETLPRDVAGTLALTAALFKVVAAALPGAAAERYYLQPEDRAALVEWRERCAGKPWPPLPARNEALTAALLWDWHVGLFLREKWNTLGYLHDAEELALLNEIERRGYAIWEWGGWNLTGLPYDWTEATDSINPNAALVIGGLVSLAKEKPAEAG